MKKMRRIVLMTLAGLGLIMLLLGVAFGTYYSRRTEDMIPVDGTVVGWSDDNPVVVYTVDGSAYHMIGSINTNERIGDRYGLMVNPEDPADCMDATFLILMWVFAAIGLAMLLAGTITCLCMQSRQRRREDLLACGRRAVGTVTEVKEIKSVSVGNRHPWVAVAECIHPMTGKAVTLRSHYLWTCTVTPGQPIDIFFDPMDDRKYAMDIREEEDAAWA